jgi:hypothetical protein
LKYNLPLLAEYNFKGDWKLSDTFSTGKRFSHFTLLTAEHCFWFTSVVKGLLELLC